MYCAINEAYNYKYSDNSNNSNILTISNKSESELSNLSKLPLDLQSDNNNSSALILPPDNLEQEDHNYYINKFIKGILDNGSSYSTSNDENLYCHLKKCKFCKKNIQSKMKEYFESNNTTNNFIPENFQSNPNNNIEEIKPKNNGIFNQEIIGCDIKEIILIVFIGIVIIFILDLVLKIGKKLNK